MTSNDDGGDKDIQPSQIPLLDDVVKPGEKKPVRRRRRKENLDLDLNPEPPKTRDLFSGAIEPIHSKSKDNPTPVPAPDTGTPLDLESEPQAAIAPEPVPLPELDLESEPQAVIDPEPETEAELDLESEPQAAFEPSPAVEGHEDEIDIYEDLVGMPEAEIRARADQVMENLLQEYSAEILQRLRDELTSLLDDLNHDDDATP